MKPSKNYIDEKGNYHNIENLTLTQIHDRGVEEGYRIAKQDERKGHWLVVERNGNITFCCSECKTHFPTRHKFCGECGADMT